MPSPRRFLLILAIVLLAARGLTAQEGSGEQVSATSLLLRATCDAGAPSELRSFKKRQLLRRQADLEKTAAALRADALANAGAYTPEDRKDFTETLARFRAELDEIHAFLTNGCSAGTMAVPASLKKTPDQPSIPSASPTTQLAALPDPVSKQPSPVASSPMAESSSRQDPAPAPRQPATSSTTQPATAAVPQSPATGPQLPNADVQSVQKELDDLEKALAKQPQDFGLVLGVGSLVINPNVSDYTNDSNVLHTTNLGSATPQILAGVSFRSHVPGLTRRWRDRPENGPRCGDKAVDNCREPWQYHPWSGFVSLKFAPGASQTLNGYVIGGTYSITKFLDVLVGFGLTPVQEASPGFRVTAAQFVANQQKLGLDLNFDPNAMLANKRNAFDGFPVTDANGKLIYQGSPTTVHYRGGAVVGVAFPLHFASAFKSPTPSN